MTENLIKQIENEFAELQRMISISDNKNFSVFFNEAYKLLDSKRESIYNIYSVPEKAINMFETSLSQKNNDYFTIPTLVYTYDMKESVLFFFNYLKIIKFQLNRDIYKKLNFYNINIYGKYGSAGANIPQMFNKYVVGKLIEFIREIGIKIDIKQNNKHLLIDLESDKSIKRLDEEVKYLKQNVDELKLKTKLSTIEIGKKLDELASSASELKKEVDKGDFFHAKQRGDRLFQLLLVLGSTLITTIVTPLLKCIFSK